MSRVSFILPAYKRRFLKEAIDSILAQTCRDLELVVVDDCSPENLKEVIDEFHDDRLSYHRNETNIGGKDLVAAWNHAMTYATGEWCVLASDDDVYRPEYLEEMIRFTKKYPEVDIVHCRNCNIDSGGKVVNIGCPRAEFESGIQMLYSSSVLRIHQRMADLMFRRSAYEKMGGFPQYPLAWYTDHAFAIRLAWENGAACSDKALFLFRNSGENLSTPGWDVCRKIEAGLLFKERVEKLLAECDEGELSFTDRQALRFCRERINIQVYDVIRYELRALPFWTFRRVLLDSQLPDAMKRRMILSRILDWFNIRFYLPRRQ